MKIVDYDINITSLQEFALRNSFNKSIILKNDDILYDEMYA